MRLYTIHLRRHGLDPLRDIVVLREGFNWPAFLFGGFWALWHRMWIVAPVLIAASVMVRALAGWVFSDPLSPELLSLALAYLVGACATDLRDWSLSRRGFVQAVVVAGEDEFDALRRYLEVNDGLACDYAPTGRTP